MENPHIWYHKCCEYRKKEFYSRPCFPVLGCSFLPGLESLALPPLAHLARPKSPWGTVRACSASTPPRSLSGLLPLSVQGEG